MTMAVFLGGAKSRLLPMSVPFRFFVAASIFQVLGWSMLLAGADMIPAFRGGLGPVLAAVHLFTLGVLTMTAAGASVQLLPVATRRPLAAVWPIKLLFWLLTPGLLLLTFGMYAGQLRGLIAGALLVTAALLLLALLLADNLRRAGSLPVVAAYGWTALAALIAVVALGLGLAGNYEYAVLNDHGAVALAHLILAGFGFMGFLAIGFSHILVPMFALAAAPHQGWSFTAFFAALAALFAGAIGGLTVSPIWLTVASALGLLAAGIHLVQMRQVLLTGMRKRQGLSFVLVRVSWAMLPLTLLVGVATLHGAAGPNGAALFGFLLLFGWLLTFLLGILQRILPFLASMHAMRGQGGSTPPMSALSASLPLRLHAGGHFAALVLLSAAILTDGAVLARAGAAIGLLGSLAFAWFAIDVLSRVLRPRTSWRALA
jgi:hypothetical protein